MLPYKASLFFETISSGSMGWWAVFVPVGRFQPIADELLIERRLRFSGFRIDMQAKIESCLA